MTFMRPNLASSSSTHWPVAGAFGLLVAVLLASLWRQQTPIFEDDALFFFRYADNLAAGEGYRFNLGEPPVCGASAPLWPLLIALGKLCGLSTSNATLVLSVLCTIAATLLLGRVLERIFGVAGVLALTPLLAVNFRYSTWATSGMESPMTFALVAAAIWFASGRGSWVTLGVVAGACLVHKLDLSPLGLALLGGAFLWRRRDAGRGALLALALAGGWYAFATWTFGSPVPNSFLTKLGSHYGNVPNSWFARSAFWDGAGLLRVGLAFVGVWALRRRSFLVGLILAQVLMPTLAYTLRPPSERFAWYVAAISPALACLSAAGLAAPLCALQRFRFGFSLPGALLTVALSIGVGLLLAWREYPLVDAWHRYLETYQLPLKQAGLWVDQNTPENARVATGWGNAGYYSRRYVYDWTFLNRRAEEGSLITKYAPEVLIQHGMRPFDEFTVPKPYRAAQVYETGSAGQRAFVAVLLRRSSD